MTTNENNLSLLRIKVRQIINEVITPKPLPTQPGVQPAAAQPGVRPAATQPAAAQPGARPAATQPAATQPGARPTATQPGAQQKTTANVKNLNKIQQSQIAQSKSKAIKQKIEFAPAFQNWFTSLGYAPGKINKATVKLEIDKVLTNLGYK